MNEKVNAVERVIGFDAHPDSFTAALLRGSRPADAIVEKIVNKVPLARLPDWAKKNTTERDLFVLEASGNSFQVVRTLATVGRQAKVLESAHLGQLKEAHANNDKLSAVRIGKAYLAGTAKEVWVPDPRTQERRDILHAYRKATKRTTQMWARLSSYLSDNGVRLQQDLSLDPVGAAEAQLRQTRAWSPRQWQLIETLLLELRQAEEQRARWRSLIAQDVLADPELVTLTRLCGVREIVAFALGAFIGDIDRFSHPKKLVKYCGLDPAFDHSGEGEWSGGIGGHGNRYLRCLLIEAAHSILRCADTPLAQWGKRLLARKGELNLAVAAMARKLTVAVWYLMQGQWTALEEIDRRLTIKVGKMIHSVGERGLQALGKDRQTYRQEIYDLLKARQVKARESDKKPASDSAAQPEVVPASAAPRAARIYILDRSKKYTPKPKALSEPKAAGLNPVQEYGLR